MTPAESALAGKPGIYKNLDFDVYARIPAINFSRLENFKNTPAHALYAMSHEADSTPSMHLGYLAHMAVLEPERFKTSVVKRPKLDRRTKAGKVAWAQFEAKYKDYEIASDEEWTVCTALQGAVAEHPTAREILYGIGASELTIVWVDPELGVLCKGRIDRVGQYESTPVILDVKTMSDVASLRNWQRTIVNYAYCEQAAMYLAGLEVLLPTSGGRRFLWLVCEIEPPYLVRLFDADYDALQYGMQMFRQQLQQYKECLETGNWPGYPAGIETCGLPAWVQKTFDSML